VGGGGVDGVGGSEFFTVRKVNRWALKKGFTGSSLILAKKGHITACRPVSLQNQNGKDVCPAPGGGQRYGYCPHWRRYSVSKDRIAKPA